MTLRPAALASALTKRKIILKLWDEDRIALIGAQKRVLSSGFAFVRAPVYPRKDTAKVSKMVGQVDTERRHEQLYKILVAYADAGNFLPRSADITDDLGWGRTFPGLASLFAVLEHQGKIAIQCGLVYPHRGARAVRILATNKRVWTDHAPKDWMP